MEAIEKQVKMHGDVRDQFKFGPAVPYLMPTDFKPLQKHQALCKICYDEHINTVFLPCKHRLFCVECTDLLKEALCPLCGKAITKVVQEYKQGFL